MSARRSDRPRRAAPGAAAPGSRGAPRPPPAESRRAASVRWAPVVLVAAVLLAHSQTFRAGFVNWDDHIHVYKNPRVTAPDGLLRSWYDSEDPGFYPVTYATFYLEWHAAGGAPWLFHVDNVLLHAGNVLLAAALARTLGLPATVASLAAALWGLHPVTVASVAWVTERKNVLYVLLWLASLLLALQGRSLFSYALSLVLFALALLSKGAAMTLPAAVVLLEWVRGRPLDGRFWARLVPYLALALGVGLALERAAPASMYVPPLGARCLLAARALWFYVATFFWPGGLLPVYPRWRVEAIGLPEYAAVAGVLVAAGAALALGARLPRLLVGAAGLFLVNVAPVLGLVWFTYLGYAAVADHLVYLPSLGLALFAGVGLNEVGRRWGASERIPAAALALWCATLGAATWRLAAVWHDSETLWTYTLARNPDCAVCHANLATALLEDRHQPDQAIDEVSKALAIWPGYDYAHDLLGRCLLAKGLRVQAIDEFQEAVRIDPTYERGFNNLGMALAEEGRLEEAAASFTRAIELRPGFAHAHDNLGIALGRLGRLEEAASEFQRAVELSPAYHSAYFNLGITLLAQGKAEEASRALARAVELAPGQDSYRKMLDEASRRAADEAGR